MCAYMTKILVPKDFFFWQVPADALGKYYDTFAALRSIIVPPSGAITTAHAPSRVDAFALGVAFAVVLQTLVHI